MTGSLRLIIIIGTPVWIAVVAFLWWALVRGEHPFPIIGLPLLTELLCAAAAFPILTLREIWRKRKARQPGAAACAPNARDSDSPVQQTPSIAGERALLGGVQEMKAKKQRSGSPKRRPKPKARDAELVQYRDRAQHLRSIADKTTDIARKDSLNSLANRYDKMAAALERLARMEVEST